MKLDFIYLAFEIKPNALKKAVECLRFLGVRGINVTMPHKVRIMKYLDVVDENAEKIGAVNTVVNEEGKLIGFNTDGEGALKALKEKDEPKGKKVVILGAGGVARAVTNSIVGEEPREIVVINRTKRKADKLSKDINRNFGINVKTKKLNFKNLKEELQDAEIVINCTSVGMWPNVNESILPSELLRNEMTVMDVVYNPMETRLLKDAKKIGAKIVSGIDMFVYQGASAFEKWTKCKAPVKIMREVVIKELRRLE